MVTHDIQYYFMGSNAQALEDDLRNFKAL